MKKPKKKKRKKEKKKKKKKKMKNTKLPSKFVSVKSETVLDMPAS